MFVIKSRVLRTALVLAPSVMLLAQDKNPLAGDSQAIEAGKYHFRINCAVCHGLGARGGGRGPDLSRAKKKHGSSDAEMFKTIHDGVPGTDMPAALGSIGVEMKDVEIWQVIAYLRSIEVKMPPPTGDAARGKELFYGSAGCSKCHMVEGKGGRLGPELTGVGSSRSLDSIVDSIRDPNKQIASGYQTVAVVTADGKRARGYLMNEDRFSVQMMDMSEHILLLEKDKLRSFEKSSVSLMPAYAATTLSDKDLNDIIAFLLTVEAK